MKEELSKILIVAITRLGDLLQATPIFMGLKEEHPNCEITVLTDRDMVSFCKSLPGIDRIVEIDLSRLLNLLNKEQEALIEAYRYIDQLVSDLRAFDFEMVLNISSSSYSALLIKLLNVEDSRGWVSDEQGNRLINSPWSRLFSANVYHANRDLNSINIVDFLRSAAGVTKHPLSLKYILSEDSRMAAKAKLSTLHLTGNGPLICIQAGASQEKRQWAPARFAELARRLVEGLDARVLFTGSRAEIPIIDEVLKLFSHSNVVSIAGATKLEELGAILESADLLITGDTGPMHMAVAVGTPVVAVFLASALCYETGPYSSGNLVVQALLSCCPCNPNFPCARPDCHEQVSPELIFFLAKKRIELSEPELWELQIPAHLAKPTDAAIFVTFFDEDNFLDYKKLNPGGFRNGYPMKLFDAFRNAHRELWKEEFGAKLKAVKIPKPNYHPPQPDLDESVFPRDRLLQLSTQGIEHINKLIDLIRDELSPPHLLGVVNQAIEETDKSIEDIGLAHPFAGTIARLFIIEKENMRGNDPLILASEMKELYLSLGRRAERLGTLFSRF